MPSPLEQRTGRHRHHPRPRYNGIIRLCTTRAFLSAYACRAGITNGAGAATKWRCNGSTFATSRLYAVRRTGKCPATCTKGSWRDCRDDDRWWLDMGADYIIASGATATETDPARWPQRSYLEPAPRIYRLHTAD